MNSIDDDDDPRLAAPRGYRRRQLPEPVHIAHESGTLLLLQPGLFGRQVNWSDYSQQQQEGVTLRRLM